MQEVRAALHDATRVLREAEALVQARVVATAATGHGLTDERIAGELAGLREAAGDLHRAVAILIAGPAGHGK